MKVEEVEDELQEKKKKCCYCFHLLLHGVEGERMRQGGYFVDWDFDCCSEEWSLLLLQICFYE